MPKSFNPCQDCPCQCFELAAILVLSPSGKILKSSPPLTEKLGYAQAELKGRSLKSLLCPEDTGKADIFLRTLKNSPKANLKVGFLARSGDPIPASLFACIHRGDILVWVKFSEEALEKRKRELLLREVHHRIKNNLQGVAGLLYNQALAHPELAELLATPIRQINSIALLYSLYSHGQDKVFLCQLCQIIAQAGQGLNQAQIDFDIPYVKTIEVHNQEAVTISLILNELLANAIKHGQGKILFALRKQEQEAKVILQNLSAKPFRMDFAQGIGLGIGLKLVKALLPKGASLSFAQQEAKVTAILSLKPPLVHFLK